MQCFLDGAWCCTLPPPLQVHSLLIADSLNGPQSHSSSGASPRPCHAWLTLGGLGISEWQPICPEGRSSKWCFMAARRCRPHLHGERHLTAECMGVDCTTGVRIRPTGISTSLRIAVCPCSFRIFFVKCQALADDHVLPGQPLIWPGSLSDSAVCVPSLPVKVALCFCASRRRQPLAGS